MKQKLSIDYKKELKECGICHKMMPFGKFYNKKTGGLYSQCKMCLTQYQAKKRQEYREEMLRDDALYRNCASLPHGF